MTWKSLLREWLDWNESPFSRCGRRGWGARLGAVGFHLITWLTPAWIILGSWGRFDDALFGLMLHGLGLAWAAPPLCLALFMPRRFSRPQLEDYLLAGIPRERVVYAALRPPAFAMMMAIVPWLIGSLLVLIVTSEANRGRGYMELAVVFAIMALWMVYLFLAGARIHLGHPEQPARALSSSLALGFVRAILLISLLIPFIGVMSLVMPGFESTLLIVGTALSWGMIVLWIGCSTQISTMDDRLYRQIDPDRLEESDWWFALRRAKGVTGKEAWPLAAGRRLPRILLSVAAGMAVVLATLAGFTLADGYPMMFGWDTHATVSGTLGLAFASVLGLGPLAVMTAALAGMGARRSAKAIADPWVEYRETQMIAGAGAIAFFLICTIIAAATSRMLLAPLSEGIMTILLLASVAVGMVPIIVYAASSRWGGVFGYTLFSGALLFMIPMLGEGFHTISQPHQRWVFYTSGSQEETLLAASIGLVMLAFMGEWLMQRAWRGLWERTLGTEKP